MDISLNYMNLKTVTVMVPLPHKGVRVISLKLKKNTISCRSSSTSNPYYETMQDKKKVNFYELLSLGSDKNVDLRDIKKAYRSMALQYHPDVCPDPSATRRFVELQKAYETLSNPVSRRLYDYELSLAHDNLGLGFGVEGMRRSSSSSSSMFIKEVWENQLRGLRRRSEIRMKKRKC